MAGVTAIIPTWNRAALLRSALSSLAAQTRPPDQIVIIDNGSTEDIASVARQFDAEVVHFEDNRGFAPAINAGVRYAREPWLLILNNDVELAPDWLERLLTAAESQAASFAAGKILSYDQPEFLDGSWDLLSRGAHAWRCGFGRRDGAPWADTKFIDFAPMTAALFHKQLFAQVGLLDERFEAYYEDVDFGLRCSAAGFRGVYEPAAVARHRGKGTFGKNSSRVLFLTARNQLFLIAKNYPGHTLRKWFWIIFIGQALSLAGAAQSGHVLSALRGILEALRRWNELRPHKNVPLPVENVLLRSEQEIYQMQSQLGFDPYWRLYFRLVRSG